MRLLFREGIILDSVTIQMVSTFIENQGFSVFVAAYLLWIQDRKLNRLVVLIEKMSVMLEVLPRFRNGKES